MKKTMKKTLTLMAMVAFAGFGLTSCGGGGSEAEADSIPTDGLLGELPMLTAKYCNKIVDLREKMFSGQLTEKELQEARAEFDATEKERDAKFVIAKDALNGKEIPVEVQDGVPVKLDGDLKVNGKDKGSLTAEGTGELTGNMDYGTFAKLHIVPIDTDGKAIATHRGGTWSNTVNGGSLDLKAGEKFVIKAFVSVGSTSARSKNTNEMKRWAKLAKYVVMDSTSDAYKQLKDQLEADKKAEELEAAKAVVGE